MADRNLPGEDDHRPDPVHLDPVHLDDRSDAVQTGAVQTGAAHTEAARTDVLTTRDTAVDRPRRRGPDPLALVVGLATLAMAVFAFMGELPDLSGFDPRWLLAGGAAVVGLALLVGSIRGRSGSRRH